MKHDNYITFFKKNINKVLVAFLCLILTVSLFIGCSKTKGTSLEDLDGTSLAKLMLANARLDSKTLDNENIFENGSQTLKRLAKKARSNRNGSKQNAANVDGKELVGDFTISDDQAIWSDFEEYNNSYSYFENITSIIVDTALKGSRLIDEAKEIVSIVDTWVSFNDEKYYLSVDENSETLCKVDDVELLICKRYTDENGKTVYELYIEQEFSNERVKYIPGERYELTQMLPSVDQELYFVADYSKGYWETFSATNGEGQYGETFTVMKKDICYTLDYDVVNQFKAVLGIMSADTDTDLLKVYGDDFSLSLELRFSGFEGFDKAVAPKSDVDSNGNLINNDDVIVYLKNGSTMKAGDTYADGNVEIYAIYMQGLGDGYIGTCDIDIQGNSSEDRWNSFAKFLEEAGLTCRRDWDSVYTGIGVAEEDASNLIKYYKWNDQLVSNEDGTRAAITIEKSRIAEIRSIYEKIKDKESIKIGNNAKNVDLSSYHFAPITSSSSKIALNDRTISIEEYSLTVNDLRLFDSGSNYRIAFAVYYEKENDVSIIGKGDLALYSDESSFTLSANNNANPIEFEIPTLDDGSYTIVSFIVNEEGIRVTELMAMQFDSITKTEIDYTDKTLSIQHNSAKTVKITFASTYDYSISCDINSKPSYSEFNELLSEQVFEYGTPINNKIEKLTDGTYTVVDSNDSITSGTYRMEYTVKNGSSTTKGYVYIECTLSAD